MIDLEFPVASFYQENESLRKRKDIEDVHTVGHILGYFIGRGGRDGEISVRKAPQRHAQTNSGGYELANIEELCHPLGSEDLCVREERKHRCRPCPWNCF